MLSPDERARVLEAAYLPEQLPDYLEAVTGVAPSLEGPYLYLIRKKHLVFIGYPLDPARSDAGEVCRELCRRFDPETVAVIAPELWPAGTEMGDEVRDGYFRLELPLKEVPAAAAYMIRRARRELTIRPGRFGREHRRLVKGFIRCHSLGEAQVQIFSAIPRYLARSSEARLLEARRGRSLAAFSVLDLAAAGHGFYLFNFRAPEAAVPGASDLLLFEMLQMAEAAGKRYLNLGLGVHAGVRRFKEKWGAEPFLPYASAVFRRKPRTLDALLQKL